MPLNIVTFTPSQKPINSLRCPDIGVEVDGLPAPWLEVISITRQKGPLLHHTRLRVLPVTSDFQGRFEEMATTARPGQRLVIFMPIRLCSCGEYCQNWPLFEGVVQNGLARLAESREDVEITACDRWTYRNTAALSGIRVVGPSENTVLLSSQEIIFNPDGLPNRSKTAWIINGSSHHIFECNPSQAVYWDYACAIRYVIEEYFGRGMLHEFAWKRLCRLTEDCVLRDIDITGLSPLNAIDRLCDRAGIRFALNDIPVGNDTALQHLIFYPPDTGRKVFLRHQKSGSSYDANQTNLWHCTIDTESIGQSLCLVGRGDIKRFESTFELSPGWDPSLEDNNFELYSPATNDEFSKVRNVFRKWVLNEAGDYTKSPFNQGPAYDLSPVFGTTAYSRRRRRFRPCLSQDLFRDSFGYVLEISYNGGSTWKPYPGAFDNLLDECGIYLNCTQFEPDTWIAIVKGALAFRITASIDSDEHLQAEICDGPIHSVRPVRKIVLDLGGEFKYRKVRPGSIFYQSRQDNVGLPDEVDDGMRLKGKLRDQMRRRRQSEYSGTTILPWIQPDIVPGDIITGIKGRDMSFKKLGGQQTYSPQVYETRMSFGSEWTTEIKFGVG